MARVTSSVEKPSRLPDAGHAGVGDQAVDLAGIGGKPLRRPLQGQVGRRDAVLAGQRAGQLFQGFRATGAQHQRRAALSERAGDRPPEATGGPSHEDGFPAQPHVTQATNRPVRRTRPNRGAPATATIGCPA